MDPDLGLVVDLPDGWEAVETEARPLVLTAPVVDGFRTNIGVDVEPLVPATEDGFRAVIEQDKEQQRSLDDHEVVSERASDQDGLPMHLLRTRWSLDGTAVSQVIATATDGRVVWRVEGTCLTSREASQLPIMKQVLASIRWPVAD